MRFGNWQIKKGIVTWKGEYGWYEFDADEFGFGSEDGESHMLVHLVHKTWLTRKDIEDLNKLARYAIDTLGIAISPRFDWDMIMNAQERNLTVKETRPQNNSRKSLLNDF